MLRKDGKKKLLPVRACGAQYIQGENNHVRSSVTPVECWWQCFAWLLSVIYQCWQPIHTLLPQLQLLTHQQADIGCVSPACYFNCKLSTANLPTQTLLSRAGLGMTVSLGQDVVGSLGWPSCADQAAPEHQLSWKEPCYQHPVTTTIKANILEASASSTENQDS